MLLNPREVLFNLWTSKGINLPSQVLENVTLKLPSGLEENGSELKSSEQSLKSGFRIGVASQVSIAAVTLASAFLHELRKEIQSKQLELKSKESANIGGGGGAEDNDNEKASKLPNQSNLEQVFQEAIKKCSGRIPVISVSARHASLEFASEKFTRVHKAETSSSDSFSNKDSSTLQSSSIHFLDPRAKQILDLPTDTDGEWDALAGIYETKPLGEKRQFVRLHTNFPHHKRGLLKILKLLPESKESKLDYARPTKAERSITRGMVQQTLKLWDALEFETLAREKGLCATMMRSEKEWEETEMGKNLRKCLEDWGGPVLVEKIEDDSSSPSASIKTSNTSKIQSSDNKVQNNVKSTVSREGCLGSGFGDTDQDRGLRVVDLSRVIAGPVGARVLAAHGASVLLLSSPLNPHLPLFELDTARGKKAAHLDLDEVDGDEHFSFSFLESKKITREEIFRAFLEKVPGDEADEGKASLRYPDREKLRDLVRNGDVVLQAYRPSGLSSRGISPTALQQVRPGLIFASLSAYGPTGPWFESRGFDSLTQTASGMNHSESLSFEAFKRGVEVEDLIKSHVQVEPKAMPVQALDHTAGYLLAFGILAAKIQQSLLELKDVLQNKSGTDLAPSSRIGFKVTLSLATSATWLKDLGRVNGKEAWEVPETIEPEGKEVRKLLSGTKIRGAEEVTLFGLQHAGKINGKKVGWDESPKWLGEDKVQWSDGE